MVRPVVNNIKKIYLLNMDSLIALTEIQHEVITPSIQHWSQYHQVLMFKGTV